MVNTFENTLCFFEPQSMVTDFWTNLDCVQSIDSLFQDWATITGILLGQVLLCKLWHEKTGTEHYIFILDFLCNYQKESMEKKHVLNKKDLGDEERRSGCLVLGEMVGLFHSLLLFTHPQTAK